MGKNIIIAAESTADLSPALIEQFHIHVLRHGVRLGDAQFRDGLDVTPENVFSYYRETGELPKTYSVNVAEYEAFFKQATDDGSAVILFTVGSALSSSYQNAHIAAESFDGVYVVDSRNLSVGIAMLVLAACDMVRDGLDAAAVYERCCAMRDKVDMTFVVSDIEFLKNGGRCSAMAALGANLLQLKPCLLVRNGKVQVGKNYRGKLTKVHPEYLRERMGDGSDIDSHRAILVHTNLEEEQIAAYCDAIRALVPLEELYVTQAGCSISTNCGYDSIGLAFLRKTPLQ